jgi:hypothetical protein
MGILPGTGILMTGIPTRFSHGSPPEFPRDFLKEELLWNSCESSCRIPVEFSWESSGNPKGFPEEFLWGSCKISSAPPVGFLWRSYRIPPEFLKDFLQGLLWDACIAIAIARFPAGSLWNSYRIVWNSQRISCRAFCGVLVRFPRWFPWSSCRIPLEFLKDLL